MTIDHIVPYILRTCATCKGYGGSHDFATREEMAELRQEVARLKAEPALSERELVAG